VGKRSGKGSDMIGVRERDPAGMRTGQEQLQHALVRTAYFSSGRGDEDSCSPGPPAYALLAGQAILRRD